MDPINLLTGIAVFLSISANFSGAKKGLKSAVTTVKGKPKTYLQKVPLNISALILVLIILGVFNIFTLENEFLEDNRMIRLLGLGIFIGFSFLQVKSFKYLKENYSQEIILNKNHKLITTGPYKFIRHPQYVGQIISDLGAGIALGGFLIIPLVLVLEIPLFILRAKKEEELFAAHFGDEYSSYKKRSGFFLPFIG